MRLPQAPLRRQPAQSRRKGVAIIGLSILLAGFAWLITSAQLQPVTARVERVIDGDTIQVRFQGKRHTVRLIGVDTPETTHPTKAVEYFGREAAAFTKRHLEGRTVRLEKDRTGDTVDLFGRRLRYVYLDGGNFNARLIRQGYAHAYRRFPFSKRREFIRLEEQARRQGKGLWKRR